MSARGEVVGLVAGAVLALCVWLPVCSVLAAASEGSGMPTAVLAFVCFVGGWGCADLCGKACARIGRSFEVAA